MFQQSNRFRVAAGCLVILPLLLAGCDSKPKTAIVQTAVADQYAEATTLQGLVSGENGPVKSGIVKAVSESGQVLGQADVADNARYSLALPAGTSLPLLLTYYPTESAPESQRMQAAAVHRTLSKYDINPASTRIAKRAKALGGYTHNNLVRAAEESGIVPANNKTTAGFRGDPTTQYGGWH